MKTPLILVCLSSAAWATLQVSASKIMTELLLHDGGVTLTTIIMALCVVSFAILQLTFLNLALKNFN
jgi:hypothetical protein